MGRNGAASSFTVYGLCSSHGLDCEPRQQTCTKKGCAPFGVAERAERNRADKTSSYRWERQHRRRCGGVAAPLSQLAGPVDAEDRLSNYADSRERLCYVLRVEGRIAIPMIAVDTGTTPMKQQMLITPQRGRLVQPCAFLRNSVLIFSQLPVRFGASSLVLRFQSVRECRSGAVSQIWQHLEELSWQ